MAQITFTIDNVDLDRVIDTLVWLFPIPEIPNPAYIDPTQTPEIPPKIPQFTRSQWAKESVRRWILAQIRRKERRDGESAVIVSVPDILVK